MIIGIPDLTGEYLIFNFDCILSSVLTMTLDKLDILITILI